MAEARNPKLGGNNTRAVIKRLSNAAPAQPVQSAEDKISQQLQVSPAVEAAVEDAEARNREIHQLAASVLAVNELAKDLQTLVNAQQANLDTITAHIDATKVNVEEGEKELVKADKYQRSWRCSVM